MIKLYRSEDPRAMVSHVQAMHRLADEDRENARRRSEAKTKTQFMDELEEIPNFELDASTRFQWYQVAIHGTSQGQLIEMTPLGDGVTVRVAFLYNEYTDMTARSFDIFITDNDRLAGECWIAHRDRISVWKQKQQCPTPTTRGSEP
jgi:hypothetical protein